MFNWNNLQFYPVAIKALKDDKILLASSDTVLGLFGQLSEISKKKLDTIKKRNLKPYIVIIRSADVLSEFTDQVFDDRLQKIMRQYWPGPLTIIFKAKDEVPGWMKGIDGTIAIRVPDHAGLQQLLEQCDGLFTTSANISDQPLPHEYNQIDPIILEQVELVCCDKNMCYNGLASTVIDYSTGSMKVLRQGAVVVDSI